MFCWLGGASWQGASSSATASASWRVPRRLLLAPAGRAPPRWLLLAPAGREPRRLLLLPLRMPGKVVARPLLCRRRRLDWHRWCGGLCAPQGAATQPVGWLGQRSRVAKGRQRLQGGTVCNMMIDS